MNFTKLVLLWATTAMLPFSSAAAQGVITTIQTQSVQVPLSSKQGPGSPLHSLVVRLEGKSIQSVSPQGLKFSVAIENPSSQDVTLRNLFDGRLKPYLRDLAGEIVELSKAATRMEKEHTARFGQRHAPDDMKIPAPYLIGEVKIGTKVLSSDDLQAETFIIPAKSQFTATISIDKVMRVPSLAPGNKSQSKIVSALPTGHYYLQLFLHCDSPQWENRASFNFGLKRNAGLLVRYVEPIGEAKLAQFR